ncbi:MAG: Plug domain-containing protein [Sphingobacteriia bacterium]|nr:Plug domain-containing protein [Sphingobacteriia bacterium]
MLWTAALFSLLQAAPMDSLQTPVHTAHSAPTDPDTLYLKQLDEVVITGSREFQSRRESPVAVHVVNQRALQRVQANNALEGLRLIPGLRTETNCQTCNYTQVRMNGLPGGYSQILWNGRPVVSSLLGLYRAGYVARIHGRANRSCSRWRVHDVRFQCRWGHREHHHPFTGPKRLFPGQHLSSCGRARFRWLGGRGTKSLVWWWTRCDPNSLQPPQSSMVGCQRRWLE